MIFITLVNEKIYIKFSFFILSHYWWHFIVRLFNIFSFTFY